MTEQAISEKTCSKCRLVKPADCFRKNKKTRIEGHHCDYAKPLDVIWLCRQCHKDWHTENGPSLNGDKPCTRK